MLMEPDPTGPGATLKTTSSTKGPWAARAAKRNVLFVLLLALAALADTYWRLRGNGREDDAPLLPALTWSPFACHGDSTDTRQCVFRNVIVKDGAIWLYHEDANVTVPTMLCSAVNKPPLYVHECKVHVVSNMTAFSQLLLETADTPRFDLGVALHRLNPYNAYHAIFEDMIPGTAMMRRVGNLSIDAAETLRSLQQRRWGLFLMDGYGGAPLDKNFWQAYLPEVAMMQPSGLAYRVTKLIAGTQASCAHWGHCQPLDRPTGLFNPPDAAVSLRRLVFQRYGIEEDKERPAHRQGPPRVTLVQRSSTRIIRNLDEVVEKLTAVLGAPPRVVDMAHLSVVEQLAVAHNTDIYVLIHGGALANLLWLPPRALVVDIYPYEFRISYHSSIVHWMRQALAPSVDLGHLPFQIPTTKGQALLSGPMPPGCVCHTGICQVEVFFTSASITVPPGLFEAHLQEGLRLWQGGQYDKPITPAVFTERQAQLDREREQTTKGAPSCL